MSYEISINKTTTIRKVVEPQWVQIGEEPSTAEDAKKSWSPEKMPPLKAVFGYAPAQERDVTTTSEIFTQKVDDLDLVAVLKAINGIRP